MCICVLQAAILTWHLPAVVYKRQRHESSASDSQFSGSGSAGLLIVLRSTNIMKMTNNLLLFFLGLLAAVHSTPISPIIEVPDKSDKDIIQEVQTDGFIVDQPVHTATPVNDTGAQNSTSTTKPEVNWNLPSSQVFMFATSMVEGSADSTRSTWNEEGSGQFTATNPSVSHTPTTSTQNPVDFASTKIKSTTNIQTSHWSFTEEEGSADTTFPTWTEEGSGYAAATDHTPTPTPTDSIIEDSAETESTTTGRGLQTSYTTAPTPTDNVIEGVAETESTTMGRGLRILLKPSDLRTSQATTPTFTAESESTTTTTTPQTLQMPLSEDIIKMDRQNYLREIKPQSRADNGPNLHKRHTTPDWIIILGFIVGLAALMALCAAIATRDKWNGPNQAYEINTNSSNQKMELEKQAFLYKEEPKENGREAEYAVIPLDELPES
ncbi:mucin-2 [Nothobranchius furzeri]|uniref:Mucin-5AC-like n=2 Tax=Nothobranchius furzeri TaxID=105023 RepID=A0A9D2Y232_NOTFU|nr:mucin-5AC-like [Nothobranchius furzeri]